MRITENDFEDIKSSPLTVQRRVIEIIENETDISIDNPTNPFVLGLETSVAGTRFALDELTSNMRILFPSLSEDEQDLFHHITTEEESGTFAMPSDVKLTFMINVNKIKEVGIYDENTQTFKTTLPKYTEIIVADTIFTLLHDIDIYYRSDYSYVEEIIEEDQQDNTGNVYSVITKDIDNLDWITFELKVKQLKREYVEIGLIPNQKVDLTFSIDDQYAYTKAYIYKDGVTYPVNITHNSSVYNHDNLTLRVKVSETKVNYTIPMFYLVETSPLTNSNLIIEIYTTKGRIVIPLDKFDVNDFQVKLPNKFFTPEASTMEKIDKMVLSRNIVDGGSNIKTFEELREEVIYNTTGIRDLPITEHSLTRYVSDRNFYISKVEDNLALRSYIASKDINDEYSDINIKANIDILHSTLELYKPNINQDTIVFNDTDILVKSNTIVSADNGKLIPIDQSIKDFIKTAPLNEVSTFMKDNEFYTIPFYYLIREDRDILETYIYDLDKPVMKDLYINNKNTYFIHNVNITRYGIFKKDYGFDLYFTLYGNKEFETIDKNEIFIQVGYNLGNTKVYFKGSYDENTNTYKVIIETDFTLTNYKRLNVVNGYSQLFDKNIEFNENVELIIYTTDTSLAVDSRYEPTLDIVNETHANAFTKETINIILGNLLDKLWNKSYMTYTDYRFKRAGEDVYLTYKDDVYAGDLIGEEGVIIHNEDNNYFSTKLLYRKGDIIRDELGNPLYSYRKGDYLKDIDGNLIEDSLSGRVFYTDVIMTQTEYSIVDNTNYVDYYSTILDIIRNWLIDDLEVFNSKLLEHSYIYYRPHKKITSPKINDNLFTNHIIKPKVTLYIDQNLYAITSQEDEISKIGKIIHGFISKNSFRLNDIREEIKTKLGVGILSVKIENIDDNNHEVIEYKDRNNRIILDKKITTSKEVNYDIDLEIEIL